MIKNIPSTIFFAGVLALLATSGQVVAQHGDHEHPAETDSSTVAEHGDAQEEHGLSDAEHGHDDSPEFSSPAVTNTLCPVLEGEPVDPEFYTEYDGQLVFLCCRKCLKQFEADPLAYVANLPEAMAMGSPHEGDAEYGDHDAAADHDPGDEAQSDGQEHDHSKHAEDDSSGVNQVLARIGRLHPMIIHFPIALILLAALAELIVIWCRKANFVFAARFCLWAGALGALLAAPLGWADALGVEGGYIGFSQELLGYHRFAGTSTAVVALMTLWACERFHRGAGDAWRGGYRIGLTLSAILVSVTGHLGASLIYGWDYLLP